MDDTSVILEFDELLRQCQRYVWGRTVCDSLGISAEDFAHLTGLADYRQSDSLQRYQGTWWEIFPTNGSDKKVECLYLADSLRDALRLRPEGAFSAWQELDCEEDLDDSF